MCMYCTCVVTVWILVSIVVVFSGEPETSVFVHSRAGLSWLQLQMDGIVGGSVLQDILINYEMLLLPPVLYLDVQERMSLMGNSIDLLQPQPELTYQTQTSETSRSSVVLEIVILLWNIMAFQYHNIYSMVWSNYYRHYFTFLQINITHFNNATV